MEYREIGQSGIKASSVALGCWVTGGMFWGGADDRLSITAIERALDLGINLIDTAPVYGFGHSEEVVGKALRKKREQAILATKCGLNWTDTQGEFFFPFHGRQIYKNLSPASVRKECEESLRRLKTDYIDLYQTHWQTTSTPVSETMQTLMELKAEGKIRAIGTSNATPEMMDEYCTAGQLDSDQPPYSMIKRDIEADVLPYCLKNNISVLAYSPLAQGLLTGKITPDRIFKGDDIRNKNPWINDKDALRRLLAVLENVFQPIANEHGVTIAQVVIAWTIAQPGLTFAICGGRTAAQVEENAVGGDVKLSQDEIDEMRGAIEELKSPKIDPNMAVHK